MTRAPSSGEKQQCNKIFPGEDAKHPERPALGWPPPGAEAWPPEAKAAKPPRLKTFRLRRPPLPPAEATRSPTWTLGCFASFFLFKEFPSPEYFLGKAPTPS